MKTLEEEPMHVDSISLVFNYGRCYFLKYIATKQKLARVSCFVFTFNFGYGLDEEKWRVLGLPYSYACLGVEFTSTFWGKEIYEASSLSDHLISSRKAFPLSHTVMQSIMFSVRNLYILNNFITTYPNKMLHQLRYELTTDVVCAFSLNALYLLPFPISYSQATQANGLRSSQVTS